MPSQDNLKKEVASHVRRDGWFLALQVRVISGWTFTRFLYAGMGLYMVVQSSLHRQWLGVFVGTYFASMGLFSWGCASGNCFGGNCEIPDRTEKKSSN